MAGRQAARRDRLDGSRSRSRDTGRWSRRRRLLAALPLACYRMASTQPANHRTPPRDQAISHFQPAAKRISIGLNLVGLTLEWPQQTGITRPVANGTPE